NYNRTVFAVTAGNACERVIPAAFSSANRFNGLCPSGQFWDLGTGGCWTCPSGYSRTVFPVTTASACEQFIPAVFSSATRFDGLCPAGQFWDILTGFCWSCPGGYARTVFAVTGGAACEKVNPAVFSAATRFGKYACQDRGVGWFLDIGRNECWSCEGWIRNLNPVDSEAACTGPQPLFGDLAIDLARNGLWFKPQSERVLRRGALAQAVFWGGHPKNVFGTFWNRRTDALSSFIEVQYWTGDRWDTVRTDADWDTRYRWARVGISASQSIVDWVIGADAPLGTYRLVHRGLALGTQGVIVTYQGITPTFQVVP
ncbi:MAG: hypothetical protein FJ405_14760, partial [Verrucomicrobia bacterium]|nr:hypothetical protein [Verrucomicrobiota bacterium]